MFEQDCFNALARHLAEMNVPANVVQRIEAYLQNAVSAQKERDLEKINVSLHFANGRGDLEQGIEPYDPFWYLAFRVCFSGDYYTLMEIHLPEKPGGNNGDLHTFYRDAA